MSYHDDPVQYERRLRTKLESDRIRSTLAFTGLYQITHEMMKRAVVDHVREWFCPGIDEGLASEGEKHEYQTEVLSRSPKGTFQASLLWLVEVEALTQAQCDRLTVIYAHRHELTHELIKYVVDPDFDPDVDIFIDALAILKDLKRFWTAAARDVGSFDHLGVVDLDDINPLWWVMLQQCVDAYLEMPGVATSR